MNHVQGLSIDHSYILHLWCTLKLLLDLKNLILWNIFGFSILYPHLKGLFYRDEICGYHTSTLTFLAVLILLVKTENYLHKFCQFPLRTMIWFQCSEIASSICFFFYFIFSSPFSCRSNCWGHGWRIGGGKTEVLGRSQNCFWSSNLCLTRW